MKHFKKCIITTLLTIIAIFAMMITSHAATTVRVTADTLNIRRGPSTDTDAIAMLSKGVECEVLGEEGDWYQIQYQRYTGYVSKEYVEVVGETSSSEEGNSQSNQSTTNEQEGNTQNNVASENTQTGNTASENTPNTNTADENAQTNTESNETAQEENTTTPQTPAIVYKKLKQNTSARILPLIYASTIGEIKKDQEVLLITEMNGWSYIQAEEFNGWVRSDTLIDSQNSTTGNDNNTSNDTEKVGYINEDLVNMRDGAGTSHNVIKVLELNSQVTILKEEGDWYQVKSGEDTGYVSKEFVSDTRKTTSRANTTPRNAQGDETPESTSKETQEKTTNTNTTTETTNTTETFKNEEQTSTASKIKGTDVVAYAKKYLGYPYVYGGNGSNGTFDCSGFTMYVYKHFEISLPHGATSQYRSGNGTKVSKQSELKTGDIVFLTDYETGEGIGHCGIYIGDGNFIHASTTTYTVTISSLNTMYAGRFYAGLRLI